ncbi:capsular exopolysaccharide synthesis family protein [Arcticibacter pallidicorallinus]|uniref:non-specific protein-tyrosine kinase n=1 Tax=Arcticibacter pallidicorallinus TaxID=1259464 RepID=A0A2T0U9A2_9SPHI|nr:tyrosine-protein kinase family protein [Arcticibacter pallidicorallinus]PRY54499.1 capsular exopolysaccharide synthesis family protein [Arcticibacter pallidicorallinus]
MKTEQIYLAPVTEEEDKRRSTKDLRSIFGKYLYHWPLFLLITALCVGLALWYVASQPPSYSIRAKVTIKDDTKAGDMKTALQEITVIQSPKAMESEVQKLKTRALVGRVVEELQLWSTYYVESTYGEEEVNTTSPVRFKLLSQKRPIVERDFNIYIESLDYYILTQPGGNEIRIPFNSTSNNAFGTWKLDTTAHLVDYVGKNVIVRLSSPEEATNAWIEKLNVALNKSAPIVDIDVIDTDPERGVMVVNHLIKSYKMLDIEEKNKVTESTLSFIDDRLKDVTGELTSVEKDVEGYKSSQGLTDISSQSQAYLQSVQESDSELNKVNVQLNVIDGIENYINSAGSNGNAPATLGIEDPGLNNLVSQLAILNLERNKLLATTPEDNPLFAPLNSQIQSTKNAIKGNIGAIKASLLATRKQLQGFSFKAESSIKNIPGQERQYLSIKRQQAIKENLYVYLLQKREEIGLQYASTISDINTIESAYYEGPKSQKEVPLSIAIMFGFLLPVGLISFRETWKNKIYDTEELKLTEVPVLAELIQEEGDSSIVVLDRNTFALAEQFRSLRSNLFHVYGKREESRVTLFTSSISGEGKSFISNNLAVSIAASGKRTVILELDLRRPQMAKYFKFDKENPGITDYLRGDATIDQIIQPSQVRSNLSIIAAGPFVDDPAELLESEKLVELIAVLRERYDDILLDTPPLHLVTDAMILGRVSDLTVYMVRQGVTSKAEVQFIKQLKKEKMIPAMHMVFNGIQRNRTGYGYNYDYSYYNYSKSRSLNSRKLLKDLASRF